MKKAIDYSLSKNDTLIIKGIAICLMLWHHLFYLHPEYGIFVYQTAKLSKLCVALFLFVSGYGLTIQYNTIQYNTITTIDTIKFLMKRFVKFYANYWVIFVIFISLGIFVFGRNLSIVYQDGNQYKMLLTDFLGLNGLLSYNITWWFNQLIICLYLCFPLLYFLLKKWKIFVLISFMLLWLIPIPIMPDIMRTWLIHFCLGIVFALNIDAINNFLNRYNRFLLLTLLILLLCFLVLIRSMNLIPFFSGSCVDVFLAVNAVLLSVIVIRNISCLNGLLQYLGKHSMNMYMIHTFVYYYWFNRFIYYFEYPALIFSALACISLSISIFLELLKKQIHLPALVKAINTKIDNLKF
jgi:peptidoglycan/LPS O-acetylase OafA/YrhL